MKEFFKSLTTNMIILLISILVAFLVLPLKLTILLAFAYLLINTFNLYKIKFPDKWYEKENEGDESKDHKVFTFYPTFVQDKWYVFCYINKSISGGKVTYSIVQK